MLFRKKPVVIEAFKLGTDAVPTWFTECKGVNIDIDTGSRFIPTLEGMMEAKLGDYIIKGVKGEIYPCKPEIFKMTYKTVDGHDVEEYFK